MSHHQPPPPPRPQSFFDFPRELGSHLNVLPHPEKICLPIDDNHVISYHHRNFPSDAYNAFHVDHLRQFESSLGFLELPPQGAPPNPHGYLFTPLLYSATPGIHVRQLLPITPSTRVGPHAVHPGKQPNQSAFALQYDYFGSQGSLGAVATPRYGVVYGAYNFSPSTSLGMALPITWSSDSDAATPPRAGAPKAMPRANNPKFTPPSTPIQLGVQYHLPHALSASATFAIPTCTMEGFVCQESGRTTRSAKAKLEFDPLAGRRTEMGCGVGYRIDPATIVEASTIFTNAEKGGSSTDTGVYYRHNVDKIGEFGLGAHYNSNTNSVGLLFTYHANLMQAFKAVNSHEKIKHDVKREYANQMLGR